MLRFLEASHSKIALALAEVNGSVSAVKPSHLLTYIERSKDKQVRHLHILFMLLLLGCNFLHKFCSNFIM